MSWLGRLLGRRRPPTPAPPPIEPYSHAGAHQYGHLSGPGAVHPSAAFTDPNAGGRHDVLPEQQRVDSAATLDAIRIPESWYSRPVYGGARLVGHDELLVDPPRFDGRHVTISGRGPIHIGDAMQEPDPVKPEWREVPVPDVCRRVPGSKL